MHMHTCLYVTKIPWFFFEGQNCWSLDAWVHHESTRYHLRERKRERERQRERNGEGETETKREGERACAIVSERASLKMRTYVSLCRKVACALACICTCVHLWVANPCEGFQNQSAQYDFIACECACVFDVHIQTKCTNVHNLGTSLTRYEISFNTGDLNTTAHVIRVYCDRCSNHMCCTVSKKESPACTYWRKTSDGLLCGRPRTCPLTFNTHATWK